MKDLLFSFNGRINKVSFWKGLGIVIATNLVFNSLVSLLPMSEIVLSLFSLFTLYMLFAITAKRYHDQGKSGWWGIFWLLPIIGWLFIIIDCGTGPARLLKNQYGDPIANG